MSTASNYHTTSHPGMRIGGAAFGARPASPDADLLAAAAEFELSGDRLDWINGDDSNLTEEECDAELDRWYAALERIAALTPRTLKGWRAKATAAYKALASTAPVAGARLDREQQLALEVLREMAERWPSVLFMDAFIEGED